MDSQFDRESWRILSVETSHGLDTRRTLCFKSFYTIHSLFDLVRLVGGFLFCSKKCWLLNNVQKEDPFSSCFTSQFSPFGVFGCSMNKNEQIHCWLVERITFCKYFRFKSFSFIHFQLIRNQSTFFIFKTKLK